MSYQNPPQTKRRSPFGSWRERRPGVWEVRLSTADKFVPGKRRTVSKTIYGTEEDAVAMTYELAANLGRSLAKGSQLTLNTYFYHYFLPSRASSLTKATVNCYRHTYHSQIESVLGSSRISSIDNRDVQRWIDGLPPQSANNYVRTLRCVFNRAVFDHVIDYSPMGPKYRFDMPSGRDGRPIMVWGANEVLEALEALHDERQLYPLWLVMTGGGLSRSEALALDWEDILWFTIERNGTTCQCAAITIQSAYTAEDGMKEPKNTRRYRTIPLLPPFSERLYEARSTGPICQSKRYTKQGGKLTARRLSPSYIPKRWKELFEEGKPLASLPFCPIGRMRATYATLMQRAGVDKTVINAIQGRSENSAILYTNYLNPGSDTFFEGVGAMMKLFQQ